MKREIEIKLKVSNPRKMKRLIRELGFRLSRPRLREQNVLFDFRDRRLERAGCALRLRVTGGQNLVTFKGTANLSAGYKSRQEIETRVTNTPALRRILKQLQLREAFRYSKYRTTYTPPERPGASLVYDETPVGNYIELEGPRRWIDRVARQLGYTREDYVAASYVALYRRRRSKRR
jgi:adenylate cyclase class 2